MSENPVLITIPISHYCEKARWALDWAGIRYQEQAHLQVIHWIPVARAGGRKTAPVLVWGDRVFADSADIVEEASAKAPPGRGLFPDDPAAAAETRALQRDFDARLGPEGRRWMYNGLRGRRDIAVAYGCTGVPAWQRRALPLAYPLAARIIDRYLDVTPATAARSMAEVRAVFGAVAERLGDGRPYLCGERFSAADLTFASLAAAVLMPPEYGVPLPQPEELPAAMAATVNELRAHPAGAHALKMFREERRPCGTKEPQPGPVRYCRGEMVRGNKNTESKPQTETLDFLIEQSRRLFEVYGARQTTAETKTAGVVTAAVALATITIAATTSAADVNTLLASIVVGLVVLSVFVALLVQSVAGLRHRKGRLLSSESEESHDALCALRNCRSDESPADVRRLVLAMWRARESDSRHVAREKERGTAAAGLLLGIALICDGVLGYLLITSTG